MEAEKALTDLGWPKIMEDWAFRCRTGTSVLQTLIDWGFTAWPWERPSWRCDSRNQASIRIAEKAGMQAEGVLRSHMFAPSGERRDTSCFAILRHG